MSHSLANQIPHYFESRARSWLAARRFQRAVAQIEPLDFSEDDLRENEAMLKSFSNVCDLDVRSVNWFVPYFERAWAGMRTILRFADYFHKSKNVENRIVIYDRPEADPRQVKSKVLSASSGLQTFEVIALRGCGLDTLPACDIAVATAWTSAYPVLKFKKTKGKFYFIQDYEPLFHPAGALSGLAEATYGFGFYAIINTPGLWEIYRKQFPGPAAYFTPAPDFGVFYPGSSRTSDGKFRLFFYGRPDIPRNAFETGLLAIRRLKQQWGKRLEVYVAGSDALSTHKSLDGELFHQLGFLPYPETGDLYRTCDAGLVLMLTRHPSYIPLELMACRAVVVSNRNPATSWLLRDGDNCVLSEPAPTRIAERISSLIADPALRARLSRNGLVTVSALSWDTEMDRVFDFMARRSPAEPESLRTP